MSVVFTPLLHYPSARIFFRADGNARVGLGHLTRCQALAELLTEAGWACVLATREPLGHTWFTRSGASEGFALGHSEQVPVLAVPADLPPTDEPDWLNAQLRPNDILVLDGYGFDAAYQRRCKQQTRALVCFDDFAQGRVWGDVVLNAAGSRPAHYADRTEPGAQVALGPGYALLRPAFWAARARRAAPPNCDRIFLNMGGADPDNHTLRLLMDLHTRFPVKHLSVVTGAAYPHQAQLVAATASLPNVRLHHNLGAPDLAELLRRCGVFVCPPSGMAYECCALGGLLLLHSTADNQALLLDYLTSNGLALAYANPAAWPPAQWPALAATQAAIQRQTFDPERIADNFRRMFKALALAYGLAVRRATRADATLYLAWANDPAVRRHALHPEPIAWAGHLPWFERRLANPDAYLYLFAQRGELVGQVRVEFADEVGVVDYSVAAAWRGQRLGQAIMRRTLSELRRDRPGPWRLRAEVRAENLASARVFAGLGFVRLAPLPDGGSGLAVFELAVNSAF